MIRVLRDWEEIGKATIELQRQGLPLHSVVQKNWDLQQVSSYGSLKNERVIDLGCGGLHVLDLLSAIGFSNLVGIDLDLSPRDRFWLYLRALCVERRLGRSYKLVKGNIERTHFAPDTFGLGISLSVIEHCVNLRRFFQETSRILKNGATLYVSTDYWDPKIATEGLFMYGIPWRIFCKSEILDAIDIAEEYGFKLRRDAAVPDVDKPVIYYFDKGYTFISLDMLLSK